MVQRGLDVVRSVSFALCLAACAKIFSACMQTEKYIFLFHLKQMPKKTKSLWHVNHSNHDFPQYVIVFFRPNHMDLYL